MELILLFTVLICLASVVVGFGYFSVSLGIEPTTFALLMQWSTTEPQEHTGGSVWKLQWN